MPRRHRPQRHGGRRARASRARPGNDRRRRRRRRRSCSTWAATCPPRRRTRSAANLAWWEAIAAGARLTLGHDAYWPTPPARTAAAAPGAKSKYDARPCVSPMRSARPSCATAGGCTTRQRSPATSIASCRPTASLPTTSTSRSFQRRAGPASPRCCGVHAAGEPNRPLVHVAGHAQRRSQRHRADAEERGERRRQANREQRVKGAALPYGGSPSGRCASESWSGAPLPQRHEASYELPERSLLRRADTLSDRERSLLRRADEERWPRM